MGKNTSFYAVRTGRKPGVYRSWAECEAQVKGFSQPRFKKFDSLKEAQDFVKGFNSASSKTNEKKPIKHKEKTIIKKSKTNPSESVKNEFKEIVYTDGSSRGNGKFGAKGGVGVFFGDNDPRNYSEPLVGPEQTNNRAELTAGIMALRLSSPEKILEIKTDSSYMIKGVTSWMPNWAKKGWKTSTGTDVKNRDLFEALQSELKKRSLPVIWTHVSAHVGIHGNEMADQLANLGAEKSFR